ncbi:MAG: AAA family ATPase [Micrococcales bacterium]|nr:AAA family ATPase [Micrococcales bacterium]
MATKIGEMAAEVSATNPWWRRRDWVATDTDLRQVSDRGLGYRSSCLDNLDPGNLYLLRGPRRVGKTVAVKQAIASLVESGVPPTAIIRVAADGWAAKDLRTLAQRAALPPVPPNHTRWWFIDEVSAVTGNWAQQIKWLRDNDPEFASATVVLTGSSARQLTAASGVLAGRRGTAPNTDRTLMPMGFATFARILDDSLPATHLPLSRLRSRDAAAAYTALLGWLAPLVRLWEQYLWYGGFPVSVAALRAGAPIPDSFVRDLFDVVYRDAFADSRLSSTTTTAMVGRLMRSMASPLNMANIAADIDLAPATVSRHVEYLRDAYLIWHCPQKDDSTWTPRERAQDKVYAIDPLIARLAHLRNRERSDIDTTILAEMQIGTAIHRAACAAGTPWTEDSFLFHARTATRKEIDFVAEPLAGVAIEGKYVSSGRWAGEAATVNASQWNGILTTRDVLDTGSDHDAWAVPAAFLAYLIDT